MSMCIPLYLCMYICMYVCRYVCMYVYRYVCMYVCKVYMYVYVRTYVCVYVCMYVCMYVYVCMCMSTLVQIMWPCTCLPPYIRMYRVLVLVTSKPYSKPLKVTKRSEETWFEYWVLINIHLCCQLFLLHATVTIHAYACMRMLCVL